ncbi:hypothetical protein [Micromonospora parathelypteridis]|uniref:Uncharacterized protein n=1 Tax=Micromonospora parathelypteridis TaxID=1839617 RepID=A0A840VQR8_9ACTN|nr:hypothetical protein [Micromonospora parathelypteridis]MBB5479513.1 hypothetical protein [Micromonospora parathelypteridis]
MKPRDAPVLPDDLPYRPSLAAARAWCRECLTDAIAGAAPTDPAARPSRCPGRGLGTSSPIPRRICCGSLPRHAGQAVTVRFTRAGCAVHRHDDDGVRLLAEGPDLRGVR